jgi:hypothetical protein
MTATYPHDNSSSIRQVTRPHVLVRAALAVERATWLDPLTRLVAPLADAAVATPGRRDFLQGRWLGHSAHPFFVTVPLGVWTGVAALDMFGRASTREACRTLTGFGVLLAVPSALTGLAEWTGTNTRDRRTATVHALTNTVGVALYARSWLARRRGQHVRGVVLAQAGYAVVTVGGFLGGHLTEGRKVGSHHPAIAQA